MNASFFAIFLVLLSCIVGSFGTLFLKMASSGHHKFSFWKLIRNKYIYYSVIFYGVGILLFIPALKWGELMVLYPLASTTYIWVTLLSMKFLKEKVTKWKWFGISMIIVGIILINLSG